MSRSSKGAMAARPGYRRATRSTCGRRQWRAGQGRYDGAGSRPGWLAARNRPGGRARIGRQAAEQPASGSSHHSLLQPAPHQLRGSSPRRQDGATDWHHEVLLREVEGCKRCQVAAQWRGMKAVPCRAVSCFSAARFIHYQPIMLNRVRCANQAITLPARLALSVLWITASTRPLRQADVTCAHEAREVWRRALAYHHACCNSQGQLAVQLAARNSQSSQPAPTPSSCCFAPVRRGPPTGRRTHC